MKYEGSEVKIEHGDIPAPEIEHGSFHAYFIYDIADTIDLLKLQKVSGTSFSRAQLELRSVASPSYIQFAVPPLVAKLSAVTVLESTAQPRIKLYDYGTISIRLSFNYTGSWSNFAQLSRQLKQSDELAACSGQLLTEILSEIEPALNKKHEPLIEDYFIAEVNSFQPKLPANELLAKYKSQLASLILGETGPLTCLEEQDALRLIFSYLETDLTIIHWDAAFVFDTRESAEAVKNIIEFANTQLVELRTYDARLDAELDAIYKWNLVRGRPHWFLERKETEDQIDRLRYLLVDIGELCDRSNNALKIIGDAFYARLYRGVALRLGLNDWQQQIESKLSSIGEIYRFATDKTQHARSQFLEIIIIILIATEIIIGTARAWR